jgi:hypothetical protein
LALSTDLEPDAVAGILALARSAAKASGGHTDFREAMNKLRNPQVGPDDGGDGVDESLDSLLARARAREGRL